MRCDVSTSAMRPSAGSSARNDRSNAAPSMTTSSLTACDAPTSTDDERSPFADIINVPPVRSRRIFFAKASRAYHHEPRV